MTDINYAVMSDQDLKRYILDHRNDQDAFNAYIERRRSRPRSSTIEFDDPQWEEKVAKAFQMQINSASKPY